MVTSQSAEQCDSRGSQEGEVSGSSKERCDRIAQIKTITSHDHQHLSNQCPPPTRPSAHTGVLPGSSQWLA